MDDAKNLTWVANTTLTAAELNTHLRDNLVDLDSRASNKPYIVFLPQANQPPSSSYATLDLRNGHPVLDFNASADESAIFGAVLSPEYNGGGLTIEIYWMATSATSGDVKWNAEIESHTDDADDLDSDSFASAQTTTTTTASASGEVKKTTITFTDGAQMDSLAAGESFRLRITRDADHGDDTMSGDAELLRCVFRET